MKLHELDARRHKEQVARVFESHLGHRIDFNRLSATHARKLLTRVKDLVKEHRSGPNFHYSERNPDYIKLVMMEQALAFHIREMDGMGAVVQDPKSKAVMDKAQRGQKLSPDEQATMNKIALAKETKKPKRMVKESEIQTAQVVLAAQDMIDRIQGMMEDISEMQFKDLPALTDSIKNDMGTEQATQFQSQAAAALTNLLAAVQAGKTEMESAQGVLTGQAPMVPGQAPAAAPAPADDQELDLGLDANLPAGGEEEEEEEEVSVGLGRERR